MSTDESSKHPEAVCPGKKLDLVQIQKQVEQTTGPEYWRSLEELAGSGEFQEMMHREFPRGASEWLDGISRRGFLQLMGASLALAGMTACTKQPLEPIVPYVRQPEEIIPGIPLYFATAFTLAGYAHPLLAKSNMGRPTKVEGNPQHPASLGATDLFAQASLLDMYDPDRSQTITYLGEVRTWAGFLGAIRGPLAVQKPLQGGGIRILTQAISSPTLASQIRNFLTAFPGARWHQWEPANRDNALAGAQMAFGQPVETQYRLEGADIIVSLDADFLYSGFPGMTRYARDYAFRRRPDQPMNRMYMVESSVSSTGGKADHRLAMRASDVEQFARALAAGLGVNSGGGSSTQFGNFLTVLIKDLQQHRGASAIIVGDHQPPVVHALAHAMNQALGNVGKTVVYTDPVDANPIDNAQSIKQLTAEMDAGKVDMLIIMGGNPVYDAPADLNFAEVLKSTKVPLRVHLGRYHDETAQLCHWHVNQTHYLEEWSDGRAYDGTISIVQPLLAPLYDGKSAHEFMAVLGGQGQTAGYDIVRAYWQGQFQQTHGGAAKQQVPGAQPGQTQSTPEFETFWRKSVHDGLIANTAFPVRQVALKATSFPASQTQAGQGIEVNIRRDPTVHDGRFSNNGWMQELPKPMTKVTWDNPLLIAPKTAAKLKLASEDMVAIESQGRKIVGAVWIQAGHPEDCITATMGYGRWRSGRAGTGAGFNVFPLRTSAQLWSVPGVQVSKTGGSFEFASVQGQQSIDTELGTRKTVLHVATVDEYKKDPRFAHTEEGVEEPDQDYTLYPNYPYTGYKWGMSIDMNKCVGCNACIIACQSENNIPVVGKEQCRKGRHMHWLRVDTYYQGDRDNPKMYFMPVPCMQCENAPCEVVCPVGATVHSTEGLNDMVYNRCVGTRYCSNNCPYKVRRFNFLLFQDWTIPQFKMVRNPDVTVRSRGVMEKCTYCVQRINHARIDSEREDRKIRDGEIETACQQACPADAIMFGDLNTKDAEVNQWKQQPRDYGLLVDLNTRPRTTYLANVRNPNPELDGQPEMK